MTKEELTKDIIVTIKEITEFEVPSNKLNEDIKNLGFDDLDQVEIAMGVEEKYDVRVSDDFETINELVNEVFNYLNRRNNQ